MEPIAHDGKIHRALADERRAQILRELRARSGGLDVRELAERVGLHANTVRWHLGILADAGLVTSHAQTRATPGRPRIVYALTEGAPADDGENYRLLATILSGTVARVENGHARAAEAGAAWGRYLVRRPPPHVRLTEAEALHEVSQLLVQQGFRAEVGDGEIRMYHCPYRELAEADDGIVCAVHRGLISGALRELGSDLAVERLEAFVEPELCVAKLCPGTTDGRGAGARPSGGDQN